MGNWVWLSTLHLPMSWPSIKLDHRYVGLFPVKVVINPVAFQLTLLWTMRIHPVFHQLLLVPVMANSLHHLAPLPLGPVTSQGVVEYEVNSTWVSHQLRGRFQYLVAWKGYILEDFT